MSKNIKVPVEEQETIIYFDYAKREFHLYTTRDSVYNKIIKKIGEPTKTKVIGGDWYIPFDDRKKISSLMSMNLYLPRKNKKDNN